MRNVKYEALTVYHLQSYFLSICKRLSRNVKYKYPMLIAIRHSEFSQILIVDHIMLLWSSSRNKICTHETHPKFSVKVYNVLKIGLLCFDL